MDGKVGPARIYIQVDPDDDIVPSEVDPWDVTWCEDQMYDTYTEYVRKDVHDAAIAQAVAEERERHKAELAALRVVAEAAQTYIRAVHESMILFADPQLRDVECALAAWEKTRQV